MIDKNIDITKIKRNSHGKIINNNEVGMKLNKSGNLRGMNPASETIENLQSGNPNIANINKPIYTPEQVIEKLNQYYIDILQDKTKIPLVKEFCIDYLDVSYSTFESYIVKYDLDRFPMLHELNKKIRDVQETRLVQRGLDDNRRKLPIFEIFLLKAQHGYIEQEKRTTDININHKIELVSFKPEKLMDKEQKVIDAEFKESKREDSNSGIVE